MIDYKDIGKDQPVRWWWLMDQEEERSSAGGFLTGVVVVLMSGALSVWLLWIVLQALQQ